MKALRDLYVLTALALVTAGLVAQDTPENPAQQPAQEPAQEPASPPANEDAESQPSADVDDEFVPTEEILADEEVTFPVDI